MNKKVRSFKFVNISVALSSILTLALIIIGLASNSSAETVTTDCYGVMVNAIPGTGDIVSGGETSPSVVSLTGLANVKIVVSPSSPQISGIIIGTEDMNGNIKYLGRARYAETSIWTMPWLTSLWKTTTSGLVTVFAQITYTGTNTTCKIKSATQNYIYNSTQSNLAVTVTPREWSGVTNSTQTFAVNLSISPTEATAFNPLPYALISWNNQSNTSGSAAIGSITNPISSLVNNESIIFNSGNLAGQTTLSAKIYYGGTDTIVQIPITVRAPEVTVVESTSNNTTTSTTTEVPTTTNKTQTTTQTTTTDPNQTTTNESTENTESSSETTLTSTTETQVSSSKITIDDATESSIATIIGSDRYSAISSGSSTITFSELESILPSLSSTNFIVPTVLLPASPTNIDKMTTSTVAAIKTLENTTKQIDNTDQTVLKFAGKAKPSSIVLVYIFSDPLVVAVTTDSDGNWEYILEDPMQPGKHEAYAVVDKGDGTPERSNPISFFISTVAASEANPEGLNLALGDTPILSASPTSSSFIFYIAGSVLAVIVALIILFAVIRSHNKHKLALITKKAEIDNNIQNVNTASPIQPINTPIYQEVETQTMDTQVAPTAEVQPQPATIQTVPTADIQPDNQMIESIENTVVSDNMTPNLLNSETIEPTVINSEETTNNNESQ